MEKLRGPYGNWALVAGAAEGLGAAFTTILAAQGFNLILIDNQAPALQSMAETVTRQYPVEVRQLLVDLSSPDAADRCLAEVTATGCRLLIHVAAYSKVSRFIDLGSADLERFVDVNIRSLLNLVHGFSKALIARNEPGGMVLVSSLAGLVGPQFVATYAATKAFSIRLTQALTQELKPHGIDLTVCMSGMVATPTLLKSNPNLDNGGSRLANPATVVNQALSNLGKRSHCIPGWQNRMQFFLLQRIFPHRLSSWFVNRAMNQMYRL